VYQVVPYIVGAAFLLSFYGTSLVRRWAPKRGLLDVPNARSSHSMPTARGGGAALVIAFFASICFLYILGLIEGRLQAALIVAGGAVATVGFLDDLSPLPAFVRFGVQLGSAVVAVLLIGGLPEHALAIWGLHGTWTSVGLAILIILSGVNFFNFMDGIDGIAASEAVFVASGGALLNWLVGGDLGLSAVMLCLAATSLGFLVWNWPPASIFMGDVGSGFLGAAIVILALSASYRESIPLEVWPILAGVFLVDACVTLVRRVLRGDRWLEPHRLHGYQHLARRLRSHRRVTLLVIATNFVWLLPWAWFATRYPDSAKLALAAALLPLIPVAVFVGAGRPEH
jgi:Fuc2NAc and GlcNAc transferase